MILFWRLEMWCKRQAASALVALLLTGWLTGESSEALTTFGKSNTDPPKETVPTPPPARPCSRQADCAGISSSSCVRTHYDPATRCLCGDNTSPVNGQCEAGGTKNRVAVLCNSNRDKQTLEPCNHEEADTRIMAHVGDAAAAQGHTKIMVCTVNNDIVGKNHQFLLCHAIASLGLYHVCGNSDECNEGLICGSPNVTSASPPHMRVFSPQDKICLCDSDNGFKEKDHTCSDADILKTSTFAILLVTCIRKVISY